MQIHKRAQSHAHPHNIVDQHTWFGPNPLKEVQSKNPPSSFSHLADLSVINVKTFWRGSSWWKWIENSDFSGSIHTKRDDHRARDSRNTVVSIGKQHGRQHGSRRNGNSTIRERRLNGDGGCCWLKFAVLGRLQAHWTREGMSTTLIPTNLRRRILANVSEVFGWCWRGTRSWSAMPGQTHLKKYDTNLLNSRINVMFGVTVAEVTALNWYCGAWSSAIIWSHSE